MGYMRNVTKFVTRLTKLIHLQILYIQYSSWNKIMTVKKLITMIIYET